MLRITLKKGESIERALKRYKRKVSSTKQLQKLRKNRYHEKNSQVKRKQNAKAAYIQYLKDQEDS